jgi:glutaconate CoA-transferase, subunit A
MTTAVASKLLTIDDAAALVPDGGVLGVGGVMDQMVPVAFLLALVRRDARDLHCVAVASGLSMDLMLASHCAREISCAIVSFEDLGTSKLFRRRVQSGAVTFNEHSELTMITRLTAAMNGLPYLPTRAALGTDIACSDPSAMRVVECPFTGAPLLACAALAPDVTIVHVDRADALGNAQLDYKHIWHDVVLARAARKVIVSAEQIVDTDEIRRAPERTVLPSFAVDGVVLAPGGAAPSRCHGHYAADRDRLREWLAGTGDDASAGELVRHWAANAHAR